MGIMRHSSSQLTSLLIFVLHELILWTAHGQVATSPSLNLSNVTCTIMFMGAATNTAVDEWEPHVFSIQCKRSDSSQLVNVEVGKNLCDYLAECTSYVDMSPVPYHDSHPQPPSSMGADDTISGVVFSRNASLGGWVLRFVEPIGNLQLLNSIISNVGLSTDPIISCANCTHVLLTNVTLRDLDGANSSTCEPRTVGALAFEAVREVSADNLSCINVRGATEFACVWVWLGVAADGTPSAIRIRNSKILNTSVSSGQCFGDADVFNDFLGFGAVVVYAPYAENSPYVMDVVQIINTVMSNNTGGFGSTLTVFSAFNPLQLGALAISRSNITENSAKHGGAVYLSLMSTTSVQLTARTSVDGNSAVVAGGNGGAFYFGSGIKRLVVDGGSSVSGNMANMMDGRGGAFYANQGLGTMSVSKGSTISANSARGYGGAVYVTAGAENYAIHQTDSISISGGSHVDNNTAWDSGGAFYFTAVNVTHVVVTENSTVNNNRAGSSNTSTGGGALYIGVTGEPTDDWPAYLGALVVENGSSMCFNTAGSYGGAVYVQGAVGSINVTKGSGIDNNSVPMRNTSDVVGGGAIAVTGDLLHLIITDQSSISGNILNTLSVRDTPDGVGGALWVGGSMLQLVVSRNSSMSRNYATKGGSAVMVACLGDTEHSPGSHNVTLVEVSDDSCVCNNTASNKDIGALYGAMAFLKSRIARFVVANGSSVSENRASNGDGKGGAVYAEGGYDDFIVCNRSAMNNNQGGKGGVVYVDKMSSISSGGNTTIRGLGALMLCAGSSMDGNQAGSFGGVVYSEAPMGNVRISSSSMSRNIANNEGGALSLLAMFDSFTITDSQIYSNKVKFGPGGFMSLKILQPDENTDVDPTVFPSAGPFYFNISRSNISTNSAFKNGGAISIVFRSWLATVSAEDVRVQLQRDHALQMNVVDSSWENNWALYGAGGAVAIITALPVIQSPEIRLASVLLRWQMNAKNSSFSSNMAGDNSTRLIYVEDVSPLQGHGGAIFAWAQLISQNISANKLAGGASMYASYDDINHCNELEPGVVPGLPSYRSLDCWPDGSPACRLRLDGVDVFDNRGTGGYGGGIALANCAAKVFGSNFRNNTSTESGGGLAFMDYDVPNNIALPPYMQNGSSVPTMCQSGAGWPMTAKGGSSGDDVSWNPTLQDDGRLCEAGSLPSVNETWVPSLEALRNLDTSRSLAQPWLVVNNTNFMFNVAADGGGAFIEVNRTSVVLTDMNMKANQAKLQGGGGLLIVNSNTSVIIATVRKSNITDNTAGIMGGGLSVRLTNSRAAAVLVSNSFRSNRASLGGAISSAGVKGTSIFAWGCNLENNTADYGAGAAFDLVVSSLQKPPPSNLTVLFPPSSPPAAPRPPRPPPSPPPACRIMSPATNVAFVHFQRCQLTENVAQRNGGAIYLATGGQSILAQLEESTVKDNTATLLGGAIYADVTRGCVVRVSRSCVSNNSAQQAGGGAFIRSNCGGQLVVGNGSIWSGNMVGGYGGAIMVDTYGSAADLDSGDSDSTTGTAFLPNNNNASSAACILINLNLTDATLRYNLAAKGGAVYASKGTAVSITACEFLNNTAVEFGGALASKASITNLQNCSILGNIAGFSGGGVYADQCAILIIEQTELDWNTALAGGAVHIAGIKTTVEYSTGKGRRLQDGLVGDGASTNPYIANPVVAILSRVYFSNNVAAPADVIQQRIAASSLVTIQPSTDDYQAYSGHGGAVFITGLVGVALSNSVMGPGNNANVGTTLATTQTCPSDALLAEGQILTSQTDTQKYIKRLVAITDTDQWLGVVTNLSLAGSRQCALLVLRATKLSWTTGSQNEQQVASLFSTAQEVPLPMLWLQDVSVSALQINCIPNSTQSSSPSSPSDSFLSDMPSEDTRESDRIVEDVLSKFATLQPAGYPNFFADRRTNLRSHFINALQSCGGDFSVDSSSNGANLVLAVPATHMRLIEFSGGVLIRQDGCDVHAAAVNGAQGADGMDSEPSCNKTFDGDSIKVLMISPDVFFNISVQLYDGLDQPVMTDTPPFDVSLSLQPRDAALVSNSGTRRFALLLADGGTTGNGISWVYNQSSRHGMTRWRDARVRGWPGQYVLTIRASSSSGTTAALPQIEDLILNLELLPCEIGHELIQSSDDSNVSNYSCSPCSRDKLGLWKDHRMPLSELFESSQQQIDKMWMAMTKQDFTLTDRRGDDDTLACPACCLACPTNAICPGGALLIPALGYWHSAPDSPRMHRCPQRSACGSKSISGVEDRSLGMLSNMASLRKDVRSIPMAVCQWWWYRAYPPGRDAIMRKYNLSVQELGIPPCHLYIDDVAFLFEGEVTTPSYMELQCSPGYTGRLCAVCQPGYSLTVDFGCMTCPRLARSISIGLLAFLAMVALIILTVLSNLSRIQEIDAESVSPLDVLKTLIVHIQYFIIITKLGVDYPSVIVNYQSVLNALTGAENFIAYSPSCLFKDLDSAGQAVVQVAFGLVAPCAATFVCLVLWTIRYSVVRLHRRFKAGRSTHSTTYPHRFMPVPADAPLHVQSSAASRNCHLSLVPSIKPDTNDDKDDINSRTWKTRLLYMLSSLAIHDNKPPAASASASNEDNTAAPVIVLDLVAAEDPQLSQEKSSTPAAMNRQQASAPQLLPTAKTCLPSDMQRQSQPMASAAIDSCILDETEDAFEGFDLQKKKTLLESPRRPGPSLLQANDSVAPEHESSASPAEQQQVVKAVEEPVSSATDAASSAPVSNQDSFLNFSEWNNNHYSPFIAGPPLEEDNASSISCARQSRGSAWSRWQSYLAQLFRRPWQDLVSTDESVSLWQQLLVVVIVASFILYPSLCQVSLSIFACYKLDPGTGAYQENQRATWRFGYWTRNMQQECYIGVHRHFYVPIGITAVLLFCLGPPLVYFLLTFKARHKFDEPQVKIQYGFLYQQYKLNYYWWASVRQLEVLGLVAVEVFGRALPVMQQALLLLAVLIAIMALNTSFSPERFLVLTIIEFLSMCVLSMTLTLGLLFAGENVDDQLSASASTVVGIVILVMNAVFIMGVMVFAARRSAERADQVRRAMISSLTTLVGVVSKVSRTISSRMDPRSSMLDSTRVSLSPRLRKKSSARFMSPRLAPT